MVSLRSLVLQWTYFSNSLRQVLMQPWNVHVVHDISAWLTENFIMHVCRVPTRGYL